MNLVFVNSCKFNFKIYDRKAKLRKAQKNIPQLKNIIDEKHLKVIFTYETATKKSEKPVSC